MSLCDEIKVETPFIIFGRNYTGQFISRIYVSKNIKSIELVDTNGLFELEQDEMGWYNLSLYRCALINVQACECPIVNDLNLRINSSEETCTKLIYTVIPGHVENAATEANNFGKQLILDFNMLPLLDANGRTSCDTNFDPSSVNLSDFLAHFHVLFENESEKSVVEHASFETRFCQMFYQSIKMPSRYKIKEMFSPGDVLTLKYKTGVDEYGNDIYYVMDKSAIYKDGVKITGPITVKYVQNDNTLTLEMPVDTSTTDDKRFTTQVIPNGTYYDYIEVGKSMVNGKFDARSHLYVMSKGNIKGKATFYVDGVVVGTFGQNVVGNVRFDGVEYKVWKVDFNSIVRFTLDSVIGLKSPRGEQFTTLLMNGSLVLTRSIDEIGLLKFPIDQCHNDFIVEGLSTSCTELQLYDGVNSIDVPVYELDLENNQIRINLMQGMFPTDERGREVCGTSRIVISGKPCGEPQPSYRIDFPILRYVYDAAKVDGKYTTGTNCIYTSPIVLNTDNDPNNVNTPMSTYGPDMYVKLRDPQSCCAMRYLSVKLKYNEFLQYKYGEITLNGIKLQENDLVWLTSQFSKPTDNSVTGKCGDGTSVTEDKNGLWVVKKGYWEYYGEVTDDMFIDLGASVTETVAATIDTNVGRKHGNYWLGNVNLKSGMVVNLQNQDDGQDGLYRVMCGEWKYLGDAGPYSGDKIDMSNDIVTYNDINFCKCGIYHIWYYYLNGSCVLNTATRTVKVVGKCGQKEGTLVPGKRIRITDYQVKTEVDKDLLPGSKGDPLVDECVRVVESFDKKYRFDVENITQCDTCIDDAIYPNCNEGALCDHEYSAFSKGENDKYNSENSTGFSMVFWQATMDDDRIDYWTMYALVGRTSKNPKEYVAYRLQQVGAATVDMVDVTDWFELLPVSYDNGENTYFRAVPLTSANVHAGTITFDLPLDDFVDDVHVGDVLNVSNGNVMEAKMRATVSRIENGVATADIALTDEFNADAYYVEIYRHNMVGYGIEISDPSWLFSCSNDYSLVKKPNTNTDDKYYILTVPSDKPLNVNDTYYAYTTKGNIRPIPFEISVAEMDDEHITYDAEMKQEVPTYDVVTRRVENGELIEKTETKTYPIRVSVGNSLTWRTIDESWSIKSTTTKIRIPKSYDFRFYNTPISVEEFVDLYNATKPQCIYPVDGVLILTDDDNSQKTDYWIRDLGDMDDIPYVILMDSVVGTSAVYPDVVENEPDPEGSKTKYVALVDDGYLNPVYDD
jgi:hypothetical protein